MVDGSKSPKAFPQLLVGLSLVRYSIPRNLVARVANTSNEHIKCTLGSPKSGAVRETIEFVAREINGPRGSPQE